MSGWIRSLWPSYREVAVGGARARYLCSGSGPPLLLIASPLALARSYRRAIRTLRRSFTVVCVELPGSGGSERLAAPWSVARYAEWVLELIRHLPLAAPIVVGDGGSTAVAAAVASVAPSEIGGLVLVDGPGTSTPLDLRALPEVAWNALHHRRTFIDHVRNACTANVALLRRSIAVPKLVAAADEAIARHRLAQRGPLAPQL